MKRTLRHFFYLLALGVFLAQTACSQRWIEADAELTSEQLMQQIGAVQLEAEGQGNVSAMSTFQKLVESPTSFIYYVDGPSVMGNALSAASLYDFGILGRSDVSDIHLKNAIVIYVEDLTDQGWKSALLVQIDVEGEAKPVTEVFESIGSPNINDDIYYANMGHGDDKKLTLKSYYTQDGELQSVVQFEVFEYKDGADEYKGKFGAMVGFGG